MGYLLLKLAGPLQSWGTDSKYNWRKTDGHPSKSAVIGMLAAALGRRRTEPVDDLAGFGFAVRVDQPGTVVRDFHTVHDRAYDPKTNRWSAGRNSWVTERFYVADAVFLAGLQVPDDAVTPLSEALDHPAFPLFLGRRSCAPATKVLFASGSGAMVSALRAAPWQATLPRLIRSKAQDPRVRVDAFLDQSLGGDEDVAVELCRDAPVSFSQQNRVYEQRAVVRQTWSVPNPRYDGGASLHDPMSLLEEV